MSHLSSPHSRLRCAYYLDRGTTYSPDSSIRVLPVDTPPPFSQTVTRLLRSSTFVFRCSPFQPVYYLQIFLPYTIAGLPFQFNFPCRSIIPFAAASLQSFSILCPPTLILFWQTPLTSTPQKASARHLSPYLSTIQLCAVCDMLYRPSRSSPNPSTSLSTSHWHSVREVWVDTQLYSHFMLCLYLLRTSRLPTRPYFLRPALRFL